MLGKFTENAFQKSKDKTILCTQILYTQVYILKSYSPIFQE